MKNNHYYIYLTESERSQVIQSLIKLKNNLITHGKYTDGVDDTIRRVLTAKTKKFEIIYIMKLNRLSIP